MHALHALHLYLQKFNKREAKVDQQKIHNAVELDGEGARLRLRINAHVSINRYYERLPLERTQVACMNTLEGAARCAVVPTPISVTDCGQLVGEDVG